MNDFEMRLGAMLSMCVDMAKGIVGEDQFAITLFCRSRFTPGHILIGDDQAPTLIRAVEELDRFGKNMLVDGVEQEDVEPASDRMAALLQEAAETFRRYEKHHRAKVEEIEGENGANSTAVDRRAKAEVNAEIAGRIEKLLAEVGFSPACEHPNATPVLGKICTYECPDCEIEFTRTKKPVETVHIDNLKDQPE
jgi:hypothetical protein